MNRNKIVSSILSLALTLSMVSPAFALSVGSSTNAADANGDATSAVKVSAEATQLTVTVPTALVAEINAQGETVVASDAKVINGSYGAIVVTGVTVTASNGWTLVDNTHVFNRDKVGSKNTLIALDNNTNALDGTIAVSTELGAQIDGTNTTDTDERSFTYNVTIPAQKTAIANAEIASVCFSVAWAE